MIHVVLDTNIFVSDLHRKRAGFMALLKLGANGDLRLHIPDIIEQEFKSHRLEEYENCFKPLNKNINSLRRKYLPEYLEKDILKQKDAIKQLQIKTIKWVEKEFIDWVGKIKANQLRYCPSHVERVFDAYFKGLPPFANKKAREDIPDSFIFETVKDLSKKYKELIFVSNDKQLRKVAGEVANIRTYTSLDAFISSKECQRLLLERRVKDNIWQIVLQMKENLPIFDKAIKDLFLDAVTGKTFGDQSIPSDEQAATINSCDEAENIYIEFDEVSYYGDDLFAIPFTANSEVYADYYLFKSDYYCMDEKSAKHLSISDWNEHYFAVEEVFIVQVSGLLTLEINTEKIKDGFTLKELIKPNSFSIDSIDDIELASTSENV